MLIPRFTVAKIICKSKQTSRNEVGEVSESSDLGCKYDELSVVERGIVETSFFFIPERVPDHDAEGRAGGLEGFLQIHPNGLAGVFWG